MTHGASVMRRATRAMEFHNMLPTGSRVLVGLSGVDSFALLRVLLETGRADSLVAAAVLETTKSQRSQEITRWKEITQREGIPYHVISFHDEFSLWLEDMVQAFEQRGVELAPCMVCAMLRNEALERAAVRLGADVVATGSHADDVLSVMLIRSLGGPEVFVKGIVYEHSIRPVTQQAGLRYCSPLFYISKADVEAYAAGRGDSFPPYDCPFLGDRGGLKMSRLIEEVHSLFPGARELACQTASEQTSAKDRRVCPGCGRERVTPPGRVCASCRILELLGRDESSHG